MNAILLRAEAARSECAKPEISNPEPSYKKPQDLANRQEYETAK